MFAPERVLIPVDFSPPSAAALRVGLDLAARSGAEPHVLHVLPDFARLDPAIAELYSDRERRARSEARREAETELFNFLGAERAGGEGLTRAVAFGHPAEAVLDYAAAHRTNVIVVGTHGRRGLRRFLLGSVASEVLHRAAVPVLVVPEGAGPRSSGAVIQSVVAPTDFTEASRLALPVAAALAALYDAPLDVVHAIEPVPYLSPTMELEVAGDLFGVIHDRARHELKRTVEAVRSGDGRGVTTRLESGRAADVIVDAAGALEAGCVVMAKHSRGALARLALGSVTERVCRRAPCPVLVLPEAAEEPAPSSNAAARARPMPAA